MAQRIYTNEILNAHDAFEGEDVGTFTEAWDRYIAGEDIPCITPDGLHVEGSEGCEVCGRSRLT